MLVGYARVSTQDQKLDSQFDKLKKFGCEKVYHDVASGANTDRPELNKALEFMRVGDTLVVWRLDRLGRTLGKLIEFMNILNLKGIGFKSLEDAIDTTTPTGKFFFHVTGAFAELERNLIKERTKAGLEAARARGRAGGRPHAIEQSTFQVAMKLYKAKETSVKEICEKLGIKRRTFDRYRKNLELEK